MIFLIAMSWKTVKKKKKELFIPFLTELLICLLDLGLEYELYFISRLCIREKFEMS